MLITRLLYRFNAVISNLSLVVATLGLVNDATACHDTSGQHIAIKLLLFSKSKDIEGILSVEKLLVVIDGVDLCLSLRDIDVVVDVRGDEALCTEATGANVVTVRLEQLVEDVVGPLHLLLLSDTGLLEQVGYDVATAELTRGSEVDTNELSETGGVVVPRSLGVTV